MNKKILKNLIVKSKTKGKLDGGKILKIAHFLKRGEFKEYLFLLRRERLSEKIIVETPTAIDQLSLSDMKKKFPALDILVKINKDLIAGMRFTLKDSIIDATLKGALIKTLKNI